MKVAATFLALVAVLAVGGAIYLGGLARALRDQAATVQVEDVRAKIPPMAARLAEAARRVQAADDESARLLKTLEDLRTAEKATTAALAPSPTRETVESRLRRGLELAQRGEGEEALRELLWCYDEGLVRVSVLSGMRSGVVPQALARLGATHPPARAALIERRDRAERQLLGNGPRDPMLAMEFAAMNDALGEAGHTLALFDKLPPGDARRTSLASPVYKELVAARRYEDAASGRSFSAMISSLDLAAEERPMPAGIPNAERLNQARRNAALAQAGQDIEVLTGAGRMESARALAEKALKLDDSPATRALIQEHATRAGRSDLLSIPVSP